MEIKKITNKYIIIVWMLLLTAGCAAKTSHPEFNSNITPPSEFTLGTLEQEQQTTAASIMPLPPAAAPLVPRFKELSPLVTERVSLSFVQENYHVILQILAHAAGLNLIISPETRELVGDEMLLTAEFQEMKVSEVLNSICRMLNISWQVDHGTIFIEPYLRKILSLDFLGVVRASSFNVGGDVLGGGEGGGEDTAIPLTGSYRITGESSATVTDIYQNIEDAVSQIIGEEGIFTLNRQTGALLVRARPNDVADVAFFINTLRQKYQRQVLIEAKIIEVNLNERHQLGIDWRHLSATISRNALRGAGATVRILPALTSVGSFYNIGLETKYSTVGGIFEALEQFGRLNILSNPRLKAMNGQSAMISVGQSISYLKSFEQTVTGTGADATTEYSTEIGTIFDGVLLGVTPIIEADNQISLHIVPIKSDLVELNETVVGDNFRLTFPRVNLREISTVARVNSGDMVLLGGLIMESESEKDTGLPILTDLPGIGRLFTTKSSVKERVEMVVALQITVVETEERSVREGL